ncbi:Mannan endo-1,4-beta-mannosidase 2 [Capsicum annuum]|nr:Mannan endo-1,4-beta-mannosidase 2 [Capsicum annuum]
MVQSPMSRKLARNGGLLYPVIGFAMFVSFLYLAFGDLWGFNFNRDEIKLSFVERNGTQFFVDGKVFYINGWNSYWLMDHAVDYSNRPKIKGILLAGAKMGLTVCRTWAFNDGGYNALQISPGRFDERVFRALDHVIAEARKNGIRLMLSLVNNLHAFGGKTEYVKWAEKEGVALSSSNDSFFYDPTIRRYFKNYVKEVTGSSLGNSLWQKCKIVLTRRNVYTGIEYRDDPTIFAWELINEPRCMTDPSGDTLQEVTGSSLGNSLWQKCKVRLCTIHPCGRALPRTPLIVVTLVHRAAPFSYVSIGCCWREKQIYNKERKEQKAL